MAGDGEHGQGHVRKRRSASRRRVMRRLRMRGHHRSAMVALLVLAGMAGFATSAAADGAHGQQAPRMHFGDRVKLTTWCCSSADGCDLLCQWPHRQHRNRTCGRQPPVRDQLLSWRLVGAAMVHRSEGRSVHRSLISTCLLCTIGGQSRRYPATSARARTDAGLHASPLTSLASGRRQTVRAVPCRSARLVAG